MSRDFSWAVGRDLHCIWCLVFYPPTRPPSPPRPVSHYNGWLWSSPLPPLHFALLGPSTFSASITSPGPGATPNDIFRLHWFLHPSIVPSSHHSQNRSRSGRPGVIVLSGEAVKTGYVPSFSPSPSSLFTGLVTLFLLRTRPIWPAVYILGHSLAPAVRLHTLVLLDSPSVAVTIYRHWAGEPGYSGNLSANGRDPQRAPLRSHMLLLFSWFVADARRYVHTVLYSTRVLVLYISVGDCYKAQANPA